MTPQKTINANLCLQAVEFAQQIIAHTLNDLNVDRKHGTPIYNLDFSVLVGNLFNHPDPAVKSFLPGPRSAMSYILDNLDHTEPYILTISGTVYYEFLDRIAHLLGSLERLPIRGQIPTVDEDNLVRLLDQEHLLQRTQDLTARLNALTLEGQNAMMVQPAKKLLRHLKEEKLHGIGDYLSPPTSSVNLLKEFNKIVQAQKNFRRKRDATRSEEESMFHYKMDAISICLTLYYAKAPHSKMLFVTENLANLDSCRTADDSVGRHFYVPLALKNLSIFHREQYVRDQSEFLTEALTAAVALKRSIMNEILNHRADTIQGHLVTQYYSFYNTFYSQLMQTSHTSVDNPSEVQREVLREILSTPTKLRDAIDSAIFRAEEVAKIVSEQVARLGLEYLTDFALEDDPVLIRIKKRFKIS